MREIKIRMLSSDKKTYFYDPSIVFECLKNQMLGCTDYIKEGYRFEQFTGLKDKNGVEIYECDIVKVDGFTPNEYIIDFIEGGFCLVTNPQKGLPIDINICYPSIGCIIEVVGNIHEATL